MLKKSYIRRRGFTLMEVMVASAITVIIMAGFMAVFIHAMKIWQQEEIKNELDFNLEEAMEKIRQDLRLSSLTAYNLGLMAFYPSTNPASTGTYSAISIPVAVDTNGDNLLEMTTNGIVWNQTIIYHVKPGTPDKLMRTVYAPRYTNADETHIAAQLASVVGATSDADIVEHKIPGSSEIGTTKCVFENLVSLTFDAAEQGSDSNPGFDCYRSTAESHVDYFWGSLVLSGGMHQITFTVTNHNPAASAQNKIAIDYVRCSISGSWRDGELF
ncbi:MAG: prepilin-type N-terminal cleavage/methylation domain-containing protein, partial [Kiritimatiellae bacterium]|nr:prepilin-type N-terminal cleavage/methylation domain-containing protein [Kiritimatiellia bacterium]